MWKAPYLYQKVHTKPLFWSYATLIAILQLSTVIHTYVMKHSFKAVCCIKLVIIQRLNKMLLSLLPDPSQGDKFMTSNIMGLAFPLFAI